MHISSCRGMSFRAVKALNDINGQHVISLFTYSVVNHQKVGILLKISIQDMKENSTEEAD